MWGMVRPVTSVQPTWLSGDIWANNTDTDKLKHSPQHNIIVKPSSKSKDQNELRLTQHHH